MPTTLSHLTRPRVSPFWLIAALLTLLVGATVYAAPPTQGGGNFFDLTVTSIEDDQVVSANTISVLMLTAHTDGTLNGTVSSEVRCEVETVTQEGICHGMATFEGEVEGAKGTLLIENVFRVDGPNFEAESFTILSGTDELASLQGEGTFSGSFDTADGTYTMAFHFHPQDNEAASTRLGDPSPPCKAFLPDGTPNPDWPKCKSGGPSLPPPSCSGIGTCYCLCRWDHRCDTTPSQCDPLSTCLSSCDQQYPGCAPPSGGGFPPSLRSCVTGG